MTQPELAALLKGIVPVLKERDAAMDAKLAALERRVAELEEELTRP